MIILAGLISTGVNAQDNREKISLGVKAGLNYSNVYDSDGEEFNADPKVGLAGGVFLAIPIGTFMGIQPELMFSQKGYQSSGNVLGFDYTMKRTTNYIDVPVMFALKPAPGLTLLLGPQYSYLLKQTDVLDTPITNTVVEEEFNNENIRKNMMGIVGGIDISSSNLVIGARLAFDFQNNNGDGTSTTPRYKNVVGQLTLGYKFN